MDKSEKLNGAVSSYETLYKNWNGLALQMGEAFA